MTITFSQMRHSLKLIKHTAVNLADRGKEKRGEKRRGGSHFVYLFFGPFLPHDPSHPVTPALILKANWPLAVGT